MTEVALALAMGFFSLLVLTMVSMGAGTASGTSAQTAVLTPASSPDSGKGAMPVDPDDVIVIYHRGGFLDPSLEPVEPSGIDTSKRVVLAFAPDVPLAEAMKARARIDAEQLVVSTLDDRWLSALARHDGTQGPAR